MKNLKQTQNKGITLIALVITIIVLLILAGVAINMAIDSDGLFGKANTAAEKWNTAIGEEEEGINDLLGKLDEMVPSPMITKWNIVAGDEVEIYLYYPEDNDGNTLPNNTNVTIDWGDGTVENYTSSNLQYDGNDGYATHTYTTANAQTTVKISGECNTIDMAYNAKLISVEQWGYTDSQIYSFEECTGLTTIAKPGKNTFKNVTSFYRTFRKCTSLTSIPEGLFANCTNATNFGSTFNKCTSLETIGNNAFENCTSASNFSTTFYQCTSLTELPADLFDDCTNITNLIGAFSGCSSLTGEAIPLWERVPDGENNGYQGVPNGEGCYSGCENLTNYAQIPSYWVTEGK